MTSNLHQEIGICTCLPVIYTKRPEFAVARTYAKVPLMTMFVLAACPWNTRQAFLCLFGPIMSKPRIQELSESKASYCPDYVWSNPRGIATVTTTTLVLMSRVAIHRFSLALVAFFTQMGFGSASDVVSSDQRYDNLNWSANQQQNLV